MLNKYMKGKYIDINKLSEDIIKIMPDKLYNNYATFEDDVEDKLKVVWENYTKFVDIYSMFEFHRQLRNCIISKKEFII